MTHPDPDPDPDGVARHYAQASLLDRIKAGTLAAAGLSPATVTLADLGPVDEFHIGGRAATERLLDQLALSPGQHVLDIGCGLGGAARCAAERYGVRVTGIDLTEDFIAAGRALTRWTGLDARVDLVTGSALAMPFADAAFDAAYMLHVGMNVANKPGLMAEVARVLKPGAVFGLYDVMRTGPGDLDFPVPWPGSAAENVLAEPGVYLAALSAAGFTITAEADRGDFARDFFAKLAARMQVAAGPPPLGPHIAMGDGARRKVANMVANLQARRIAPVEMIARRGWPGGGF